jgi:hypothetical protein
MDVTPEHAPSASWERPIDVAHLTPTEPFHPAMCTSDPDKVEGDVEHHTPISGDAMTGAGDGGAELAAGQILLVGSQPRILSHVFRLSPTYPPLPPR